MLAMDLLERALSCYTAMYHGQKHGTVVSTMREIGKTLNLQLLHARAGSTFEEALALAQEVYAVSSVEVSLILMEMAINCRDINQLDRAKELTEESLQMRIACLGECAML